jgi:hypothetical protein
MEELEIPDIEAMPTRMPAKIETLPPEWRALVSPDHRHLWSQLDADGKRKVLTYGHTIATERAVETRRRLARQALVTEYIDALCSLPRRDDPGYEAAWQRLQAAKAARGRRGRHTTT